jgi:hypothetical protein
MTQDYGTVQHNGVELTLTQQVYIDADCFNTNNTVYRSHAVDTLGNEYAITWPVVNVDCEEESESCDWSHYTVQQI